MPYITKKRRQELDGGYSPREYGEVNYIITTRYIIPKWKAGKSYATIAFLEEALVGGAYGKDWELEPIKGMLEGMFSRNIVSSACRLAFMEFYRRVASKYENQKAKANGDVYKGI